MEPFLREMVLVMIGRQITLALLRRRINLLALVRQLSLLVLTFAASVLIGWLLMEEEQTRRRSGSAAVLTRFREPEIPLTLASNADDLTVIDGIGPTYARALNEAGVMSFADLARENPAELSQRLNGRVSASRIHNEDWIGQAQQLEAHSKQ